MDKNVSFAGLSNNFPAVLKQRVDEYFKSNNLRQTGNARLYAKTIILLIVCFSSYWVAVFVDLPFIYKCLIGVVFGLTNAGIGFCVMHDGAHGSYSQKPWLNNLMGYTLNLFGGSVYFWKIKHNVIHHNVTNIEGHDDDINLRPLMRTCEHQPYHKFHKLQHVYGIFLYSLTTIWWILFRDFLKYFSGKIASKKIGKMPLSEHLIFWFTKLYYFTTFLVLPILLMGPTKAILFFLVWNFSMGFALAIVFQLAHVVEDTDFPLPADGSNKINHDWFYHQFATTANFATQHPIITWYTGGLNYQVEHHLFPRISHIHYPSIHPIVKKTCAEFNVPYNEFPSMWSAIISHFSVLKKLGKEKNPVIKEKNPSTELVGA
ncbi:MAG: fatty acid desaturase family protein [Bacteroidota bacterium]|jgi:linoleoyl-CoA desaturase